MNRNSSFTGKKLISVLLTVLMVFGCFSLTAVKSYAANSSWATDGYYWQPLCQTNCGIASNTSTDLLAIFTKNGQQYAVAYSGAQWTSFPVSYENGTMYYSTVDVAGENQSSNITNIYYLQSTSTIIYSWGESLDSFTLVLQSNNYTVLDSSVSANNNGLTDFYFDGCQCTVLVRVGYSVVYQGNGGTTNTGETNVVYPVENNASHTVIASPFTRSGYAFTGWKTNTGVPYNVGTSVTVSGPLVFVAQWNRVSYPVDYRVSTSDAGKGSLSGSGSETVYHGEFPAHVPTPVANTGYKFAGWSTTDGGAAYVTPSAYGITQATVFYANFGIDNVTVKYAIADDSAGMGVLTGGTNPETVQRDSKPAHVPTPTANDGYEFVNWTNGSGAAVTPADETITADTTFYANFQKDDAQWATVVYQPGEHGTFASVSKEVYVGVDGAPYDNSWEPAIDDDDIETGYTKTGWSGIPTGLIRGGDSVTLTAQYTKTEGAWTTIHYTSNDAHGSLTDGEKVVEVLRGSDYDPSNEPTAFTADPGYRFKEWTGIVSPVTGDELYIYATFEKIPEQWASVTYKPGEHGTFEQKTEADIYIGTGIAYNSAWEPSDYTSAETGWEFECWMDESGTKLTADEMAAIVVTESRTFTAVQQKDADMWITVTYEYDSTLGSAADAELSREVLKGTPYDPNWAPEITATKTGYERDGWANEPETDAALNESVVITAKFKKTEGMWPTVTYVISGTGASFGEGETTTRELLKDGTENVYHTSYRPAYVLEEGYEITAWQDEPAEGDLVTSDIVIKLTVQKQTFTVTYVDGGGAQIQQETVTYGTQYLQTMRPAETYPSLNYTYTNEPAEGTPITENQTITVTTAAKTFTVTYVDGEGSQIKQDTVDYGTEYSQDMRPEEEASKDYTYTDEPAEGTPITDNVNITVTAVIKTFEINWVNWDGSPLETDPAVAYGETPSYDGATPERESDPYAYFFKGWTPEIEPVTTAKTYTAVFETKPAKITYVADGDHGTVTGEMTKDTTVGETYQTDWRPAVTPETGWTYTFENEPTGVIEGDVTITIHYEKIPGMWATITYISDNNGFLYGTLEREVLKGTEYNEAWRPVPGPFPGYRFLEWLDEPEGAINDDEIVITARFVKETADGSEISIFEKLVRMLQEFFVRIAALFSRGGSGSTSGSGSTGSSYGSSGSSYGSSGGSYGA